MFLHCLTSIIFHSILRPTVLELHKRIIATAETSLCPAAVMYYCLYLAGIDTQAMVL